MFKVKVRNYEGQLIMIIFQCVEHIGEEEVYLYKVIIRLKENEEITLEKVKRKEIFIYKEEK